MAAERKGAGPLDTGGFELLIDGVARQSVRLIAHIAVFAGRSRLSGLTEQMFGWLVGALRTECGLSHGVVQSMLELPRSTYFDRLKRESGDGGSPGSNVWLSVLMHLYRRSPDPVSAQEFVVAFPRVDERVISAILSDLQKQELVRRSDDAPASGTWEHYEVADAERVETLVNRALEDISSMVLVSLFQHGPIDAEALAACLSVTTLEVEDALHDLKEQGLIEMTRVGGVERWDSQGIDIAFESAEAWHAAVYDHVHTMVNVIIGKLRSQQTLARMEDEVGGSTFTYEVWPGHPYEAQVGAIFARVRGEADELLTQLREYEKSEEAQPRPPLSERRKVVFYCGQSVHDLRG